MKISHTLAATYLLVAATIVSAQVVPEQDPPYPTPPAPVDEAATTEVAAPSYTDEQVAGFAAASLQLREVNANAELDDAAKMAEARSIVTSHGLDPETYNAIAVAARTDERLAARVQEAVSAKIANSPGQ
ncbi:DUF4168 domain-containing protein [Aurantiacibacter gilvus]|uniref:DUF4168 domain-containing protein n=1 Tax=Aurantiacibacter gilvus TaxID=3139141 RepID=A0ABU9IA17_9SPHN